MVAAWCVCVCVLSKIEVVFFLCVCVFVCDCQKSRRGPPRRGWGGGVFVPHSLDRQREVLPGGLRVPDQVAALPVQPEDGLGLHPGDGAVEPPAQPATRSLI